MNISIKDKQAWKKRRLECGCTVCEIHDCEECERKNWTGSLIVTGLWLTGLVVMLMAILCAVCGKAGAEELPKWRVVYAIIGEAESEGLEGMRAIACTIQTRGTLKGVYGEKAPRVKQRKYSNKTLLYAIQAYEDSLKPANCLYMEGASGWGNANDIKIFKTKAWWKKCKIVKQIKSHYFYKEIR